MDWLNSVRKLIPITEKLVYLDNAGAGPLPKPTVEAVKGFLEKWMTEGEPWEEALEAVVEARRLFARLIGARLEEVAAAPGLTYGLNALLSSLRLRGGNAVASPYNFPTSLHTLHALRRRGAISEVRVAWGDGACVPHGEWEKVIDEDTVVVLVDHVYWTTGCLEDLRWVARVAHEHGAIVVTDAFHSVGVLPVDVRRLGVDALLAGSYKWLMGPHGAAFVYVRRELLEDLDPSLAGWMGIEDGVLDRMARGEPVFRRPIDTSNYRPAPDARRLEWGTLPLPSFVGALESLKLLVDYNAPGRYHSHTAWLVERLYSGLEELGYEVITPRERAAGIVVFRHEDPYAVAEKLEGRGIKVSPRPGRVRVSPHFYNTADEIDRLLEALGPATRP